MQKVSLLFFVNASFDCLTVFEQAFRETGFDVEAIRIPDLWPSPSRKQLRELRTQIAEKKLQGRSVIFSPQSTDLFLPEADLTVCFSAYRSSVDSKKVRTIPHLWTPIAGPNSVESISWKSKPPLRIGFMGRLHTYSKVPYIVTKFPTGLKQWLLRGKYLMHADLIALMYDLGFSFSSINTFPRIETIRTLTANKDRYDAVELDIILKQSPFGGSDQEMKEYVNHLQRNTYIICPRGAENYSFRVYETLSRGRVPVIIDTDVVLPKEIDWDYHSVRVPYRSLANIYDIIIKDYESRSGEGFAERQRAAISLMTELRTMGWVKKLASEFSPHSN